jgi:hypothetical protein
MSISGFRCFSVFFREATKSRDKAAFDQPRRLSSTQVSPAAATRPKAAALQHQEIDFR